MFNPVIPGWPNWLKSHPPATAPTTPSTMSITTPSPVLFTILLATKPAIRPRTIQARIDIRLPTFPQSVLPDFGELPAQSDGPCASAGQFHMANVHSIFTAAKTSTRDGPTAHSFPCRPRLV